MLRALSILITAVLVAQATLGGVHGSIVLCLGHGHAQSDNDASCASACEHERGVQTPAPADDHDCDCCDDIELTFAETLVAPRFEIQDAPLALPVVSHRAAGVSVGAAVSWRGPPPWQDASREQRLAVVSVARLTL